MDRILTALEPLTPLAMPASEHGVGFLEILPAELRDEIWRLTLISPCDSCDRARHPPANQACPWNHRHEIYSSLRDVNRQVASEVEAVFNRDVSPDVLSSLSDNGESKALWKRFNGFSGLPVGKKQGSTSKSRD